MSVTLKNKVQKLSSPTCAVPQLSYLWSCCLSYLSGLKVISECKHISTKSNVAQLPRETIIFGEHWLLAKRLTLRWTQSSWLDTWTFFSLISLLLKFPLSSERCVAVWYAHTEPASGGAQTSFLWKLAVVFINIKTWLSPLLQRQPLEWLIITSGSVMKLSKNPSSTEDSSIIASSSCKHA